MLDEYSVEAWSPSPSPSFVNQRYASQILASRTHNLHKSQSQQIPEDHIHLSYRDFSTVFEPSSLPRRHSDSGTNPSVSSSGVPGRIASWHKRTWSLSQPILSTSAILLRKPKPNGGVSWVKDCAVADCHHCKTGFTFFNRRHHCRKCGHIFCGSCSNRSLSMPTLGFDDPVRVCEHCYHVELDQQRTERLLALNELADEAEALRMGDSLSDSKELGKAHSFREPPSLMLQA
eukprot:TRINITY_DN4579_c0_g1_i1.p1 TRINITY_DN4579_c0_g1~~TRINITY_DN4579_c0_g1_i1.p1  ORF type:complete len:232 (-),score=7.63 TRINITY_DN4579_c0_g1_i1:13-708(-)